MKTQTSWTIQSIFLATALLALLAVPGFAADEPPTIAEPAVATPTADLVVATEVERAEREAVLAVPATPASRCSKAATQGNTELNLLPPDGDQPCSGWGLPCHTVSYCRSLCQSSGCDPTYAWCISERCICDAI